MIVIILLILLFVLYGFVVVRFWYQWNQVPVSECTGLPGVRISVIIPARNEAHQLPLLLDSLEKQTYPSHLTEIIVVDDHSTDNTAAMASRPSVRLIRLQEDAINSYKKKAIETGIRASTGTLIVTTDADCVVPPEWLEQIAVTHASTGAVFLAGPVSMTCDSSVVEVFQSMDFMVLQGITGATAYRSSLSMCNGANLAYTREAFETVGGFSGIDRIASGDDMLLMFKITKRFPGKTAYIKSKKSIVSTAPMNTWRSFFNQRIRWASKATHYDDKRLLPVLMVVYLFNLAIIATVVGAIWDVRYGWLALGLVIGKTLVELPLFVSVATFFNKRWSIKWFPVFQPVHILYTVISGFLGQVGSYEWKGRRVK